jgi:hypothetical protein
MVKRMQRGSIQIELPVDTINTLERIAQQEARSINEVARDLILKELPPLPSLSPDVETELAALANLSDETLSLLAESTLPPAQQKELAMLNHLAQQRALTVSEAQRQQGLVNIYERTLVRKGQAAAILKDRGYDLSLQKSL